MGGRLWEIDAARTFAIVLMVAYHAAYDVHLLAPGLPVDPGALGWEAVQTGCGSLFLALVGVSHWVADRRARSRGAAGWGLWRRHARRGRVVLAAAGAVSVATRLALGREEWVRFGILHLIAVAVLVVLPLTVRLGRWNALLGVAVVAAGLAIRGVGSDVPGALVLGFDPGDAGSDWYPLLPWLGATLVGVAVGSLLYPAGERGPLLTGLLGRFPAGTRATALLAAPGRHALPVYLAHQPVLVALLAGVLALAGHGPLAA